MGGVRGWGWAKDTQKSERTSVKDTMGKLIRGGN